MNKPELRQVGRVITRIGEMFDSLQQLHEFAHF